MTASKKEERNYGWRWFGIHNAERGVKVILAKVDASREEMWLFEKKEAHRKREVSYQWQSKMGKNALGRRLLRERGEW